MARVLILGGGCRGRQLAAEIVGAGHAVRIVTRSDARRPVIVQAGAECLIGDPNRLGTLRGALEGVTIACWLLGTAAGSAMPLHDLHHRRLPAFLEGAIDSTMRGFIYEAPPAAARRVREIAERNAIAATPLTADPTDVDLWLKDARANLSVYL